jgi:hypothetical protein
MHDEHATGISAGWVVSSLLDDPDAYMASLAAREPPVEEDAASDEAPARSHLPSWDSVDPEEYAIAFARHELELHPAGPPGPSWNPAWGPDPRDDPGYDPVSPEQAARLGAMVRDGIRGAPFVEPEDRGLATASALGDVEYVEDLIRPGRICVWAAEEGSGKSYAVDDELGIRVAVAGGAFAETWPILRTGPVVYLSEMHPDDDFEREATVLASLGLERSALLGRLYRLSLMTAAGGRPPLMDPEWCAWMTAWLCDRGALLLIVDTATAATQVDPWGQAIQAVYTQLRVMLAAYPELAIILVVHVRKPTGHGERRISDVLGEWGRWSDVVVMQENDGSNLDRTKITVRKRVRHQRRIVATKRGGLLVDPVDASGGSAPKVPTALVLAAIEAKPGLTYAELGKALEVSKDTASRYVKDLGGRVETIPTGPRGANRVFPSAAPPHAPT